MQSHKRNSYQCKWYCWLSLKLRSLDELQLKRMKIQGHGYNQHSLFCIIHICVYACECEYVCEAQCSRVLSVYTSNVLHFVLLRIIFCSIFVYSLLGSTHSSRLLTITCWIISVLLALLFHISYFLFFVFLLKCEFFGKWIAGTRFFTLHCMHEDWIKYHKQ